MLRRLKPIFESLQRNEVRYLVLGGIAVALHGVPRATFDVNLLIEASIENARRLLAALGDAGFGTAALVKPEEVVATEITRFKDRIPIDVITRAPGLLFSEAWEHRQVMHFEGQDFYVVSREDLIRSKGAAGRPRDLEDLRALGAGA
ncbi:MAG: DUF6036 family nucleotidyltransferase [Terriglobales bacterium]